MSKTKLEKQIEIIAKKQNIFTVNDLEVLLEQSKIELIPTLEIMISKKNLKVDGESYIYIPKKINSTKANKEDTREFSMIRCLPFQPKKPKEVYLRRINELDGFVDYFFAHPKVKQHIQKMIKILKETHNVSKKKLNETLDKYNITPTMYYRFKNEISKNGLTNLVGTEIRAPGEIYHFFKEYYLTPKQLTPAEARELAIQRFERLIKMKINRNKVISAMGMVKRISKEYTKTQIQKYRNYNFSKFDVDKMFEE